MDVKLVPVGADSSEVAGTIPSLSKFYISETSVSYDSDLLTQLVLKTILTKRGSMITNPSRGSSIPDLAGKFNVLDVADSIVMLQQEIKDVENQVIDMQGRSANYKPRERLQSISVSSAVPESSSIVISITIINQLNQASFLKVSV